jgi:hypothetical protein
MTAKLLLISTNVKDMNIITTSLEPDVKYIVISPDETIASVRGKINSLGLTQLTRVGLMFDNTKARAPFIEYSDQELTEINARKANTVGITKEETYTYFTSPTHTYNQATSKSTGVIEVIEPENDTITDVIPDSATEETYDITVSIPNSDYRHTDMYMKYNFITPDTNGSFKFFSDGLIALLSEIKSSQSITFTNLDIISCNISNHSQFNQFSQYGITVNYSENIIGGNNWILSSSNTNLINLYFNENITDYTYKLGGVAPTFNGTCYEILNQDNLYWLMTYATNVGAAPNLSSTFCITADIDMTSYAFSSESIGKNTAPDDRFTGILQGNNKTITINNVVATYSGFFKFLGTVGPSVARVENLNLIYKQNTYTLNGINDFLYFGFLIGIQENGICTNCNVSFNTIGAINVTLNNDTPGDFVTSFGGLIGIMRISDSVCTGCSLTVTVPMTVKVGGQRGTFVGGAVGQINMSGSVLTPMSGVFQTTVSYNSLTLSAAKLGNPISTSENNIYIAGFIGFCVNNSTSEYIYVNNNTFNCQNLIMDNNITGSIPQNISLFIAGFCANVIVTIFNNNICQIGQCTITPTATAAQLISGVFGQVFSTVSVGGLITQVLNMNVNIGPIIITAGTLLSAVNITVQFAGFCSSLLGNTKINNIILNIQSIKCTTTPLLPITTFSSCIFGGFFGQSAGSIPTLFEISSINYNIQTIELITNILNQNITFGGVLGNIPIIINTCINNIFNINSISIIRNTPLPPGSLTGSTVTIGSFAGIYRGNLDTTTVNIGTMNINIDTCTSMNVGGVIGLYSIGTQNSLIQNSSFNITNLNILTTTLNYNNNKVVYMGGLIGDLPALANTTRRSILNSTLNIENFIFNSRRTLALPASNTVYFLGGLIGRSYTSGTISPTPPASTFNPVDINNVIANIGSLLFNIEQIEGPFLSSAIIGSCTNPILNMSNCSINYNSFRILASNRSAFSIASLFGGISGDSTNISVAPNNVGRGTFTTNTINMNSLFIQLAPQTSFIIIGLLACNPSGSLFQAQNNTINIGSNSYLEGNSAVGGKYIGLLLPFTSTTNYNLNVVTNNTVILQSSITMTGFGSFVANFFGVINFASPGGAVTNLTNKVYIKNINYPLIFNTLPLPNIIPTVSVVVDGINYILFPEPNTIKTITGYSVTYSQTRLIFFFEEIVPQPVITCCTANVCDANPQTANFDSSNAIQSQAGQQLVSAVDDLYAGAAAGKMKPCVQPIFKTYGQMMEWKQRQNRR